jgi:hypothetical protein
LTSSIEGLSATRRRWRPVAMSSHCDTSCPKMLS